MDEPIAVEGFFEAEAGADEGACAGAVDPKACIEDGVSPTGGGLQAARPRALSCRKKERLEEDIVGLDLT